MFKIWAKVLEEEKIVKQTVYEGDEFSYADFFTHLSAICDELDIPTPILLRAHIVNYAKFRHVVFRPRDFLDPPPFDKLVLENISI